MPDVSAEVAAARDRRRRAIGSGLRLFLLDYAGVHRVADEGRGLELADGSLRDGWWRAEAKAPVGSLGAARLRLLRADVLDPDWHCRQVRVHLVVRREGVAGGSETYSGFVRSDATLEIGIASGLADVGTVTVSFTPEEREHAALCVPLRLSVEAGEGAPTVLSFSSPSEAQDVRLPHGLAGEVRAAVVGIGGEVLGPSVHEYRRVVTELARSDEAVVGWYMPIGAAWHERLAELWPSHWRDLSDAFFGPRCARPPWDKVVALSDRTGAALAEAGLRVPEGTEFVYASDDRILFVRCKPSVLPQLADSAAIAGR